MPTTGLWKVPFRHAIQLGLRCSVVDLNGSLIAIENWPGTGGNQMILGHGWFEFLAPDTVALLLEWFAEAIDSGPITYIGPGPGGLPVIICLVKSRVGGCWLTVGDFSAVPPPTSGLLYEPSLGDPDRRPD